MWELCPKGVGSVTLGPLGTAYLVFGQAHSRAFHVGPLMKRTALCTGATLKGPRWSSFRAMALSQGPMAGPRIHVAKGGSVLGPCAPASQQSVLVHHAAQHALFLERTGPEPR